jgi:hypothetical protein
MKLVQACDARGHSSSFTAENSLQDSNRASEALATRLERVASRRGSDRWAVALRAHAYEQLGDLVAAAVEALKELPHASLLAS